MRRLCCRVARSDPSFLLACLVPVCIAIALAGCAASSASERAPAVVQAWRADAEMPPRASMRRLPDDPSEPYSPNYGSRPPYRFAETVRRLSNTEADAIIAAAIAAHEMRRP